MRGQGRRGGKRIDGSNYPRKDGVLEMGINWVSRAPRVAKWLQKEKRKQCRERDEECRVSLSSQRLAGCWIMDAGSARPALVADNFYDHIWHLEIFGACRSCHWSYCDKSLATPALARHLLRVSQSILGDLNLDENSRPKPGESSWQQLMRLSCRPTPTASREVLQKFPQHQGSFRTTTSQT
jgi:hypothetical protein